jgi:peptidoglycan/xylan/chitin deacetylase (PgdA/CDA1 family)
MGTKIAALMYHDVEATPAESGFRAPSAAAYKLDLPAFRSHLEIIARGPVRPTTVFEALASPREKHVLLTFDDGGKSAIRIAGLLEERGWCGHFFITTAMIGESGFVTGDEIRELHRRGHVVGSH